jgi:hypothetical protein
VTTHDRTAVRQVQDADVARSGEEASRNQTERSSEGGESEGSCGGRGERSRGRASTSGDFFERLIHPSSASTKSCAEAENKSMDVRLIMRKTLAAVAAGVAAQGV